MSPKHSKQNNNFHSFRQCLDPKFKIPKVSHRMVAALASTMHGGLNIDEIKKLIAQFACKLQDESNEPN
jgi:hypothetical protein